METFAHRGYLDKENTLASFHNAFPRFTGIEFDVRLSKDRKPMVIHDSNLKRTHKREEVIHHTHSSNLINIGLPTLEEVLLLAHKKKKKSIVDIKVKANTDRVVEYILEYTKKHKLRLKDIICISYTDDHKFPKGVLFWRGYRLEIPKQIDTRNYGMAVQFIGTPKGTHSILHTLEKHDCHVNIYIREIPNQEVWDFLQYIKNQYSDRISITVDPPMFKVLKKSKYL